jgi:hypothetical protein
VGGIRSGCLTGRDREKDALTAFRYTGAWHKPYAEVTSENPANRGVVDLNSFIHSFSHAFIHSFTHTLIRSFILSFTLSFTHSLILSFIHSFIH